MVTTLYAPPPAAQPVWLAAADQVLQISDEGRRGLTWAVDPTCRGVGQLILLTDKWWLMALFMKPITSVVCILPRKVHMNVFASAFYFFLFQPPWMGRIFGPLLAFSLMNFFFFFNWELFKIKLYNIFAFTVWSHLKPGGSCTAREPFVHTTLVHHDVLLLCGPGSLRVWGSQYLSLWMQSFPRLRVCSPSPEGSGPPISRAAHLYHVRATLGIPGKWGKIGSKEISSLPPRP